MNKQNKGFTLIELLVVIMIVVVLTSVSLVGIQGARESARDGRRMSDLETIRSALEIYKADCGVYPATSQITAGATLIRNATECPSIPSTNVYLQSIPGDPTGGSYTYNRTSNTTYNICADLEGAGNCPNTTTGCCSATLNYRVVNP